MRTHESVLLANYEIEQKIVSEDDWYAIKYLHHGVEVMENRLIVVRSLSGKFNLQAQINALGSFHESEFISLTREQMEFLQKLKL